ncbi:Ubiquitin-conjugating enzyme E2 J1 [Labeo rohita]|uniref:Ubiquitin-conjugating enzyme E2 J1 n=1 Tax=Labeo rohita TaxID=84645 RepID=A0ABQ8L1P5_LABRO|nr:Ubiquitin-conjugating enzyme E2 J1 [Labeo rohita]
MKEAAELRDPTEHYHAQPLEDNLFEWHFSVRGPPDSDFDGGVYHGRIPNGRFEVGKKICLSISGHHPETWQPSWSIRTALIAIIGFMPTKGEGAIGSLDYTPEERRALAKNDLRPVDPQAHRLAQQINFKTESSFAAPETSSEGPSVPAAPSPRQRRSQNQTQSPRYPAFTPSPAAQIPQEDASHTGSAVLIVLLTLALAALIFRRIYLAHEYKFDYEL